MSGALRKPSAEHVTDWRRRMLDRRSSPDGTPIPLSEHVIYVSGLIMWASLALMTCVWLASNSNVRPPWYLSLAMVLIGIFIADLVSGVLHWAFDTWFDEDAPFLQFVIPVREHHIYPQRILKLSFYENVGIASWQGVLLTAPGMVILGAFFAPSPASYSLMVVSLSAAVGLLLMFVLHQQAHNFRVPRWVRVLRQMRLILDARTHLSGHHSGQHDEDYCLVNGWADKTLGRAGFWRGLEWLISSATGSVPRRDDELWAQQFNRRRTRTIRSTREHGTRGSLFHLNRLRMK